MPCRCSARRANSGAGPGRHKPVNLVRHSTALRCRPRTGRCADRDGCRGNVPEGVSFKVQDFASADCFAPSLSLSLEARKRSASRTLRAGRAGSGITTTKAYELEKLLHELRDAGIRLRRMGGGLQVVAPRGALTEPLRQALRLHKAQLLELLASCSEPGEAPPGSAAADAADPAGPVPLTELQQLDGL